MIPAADRRLPEKGETVLIMRNNLSVALQKSS
jgi:hypothetical protein